MSEILAFSRKFMFCAALLPSLLFSFQCSATAAFKVLHSFTGGSDEGYPGYGSLIMDASGNLYGTTAGVFDAEHAGTVFKLAPNDKETVLYTFDDENGGFYGPAALVMDKQGNLWGSVCCGIGADECGMIFEITTSGTEELVHAFAGKPRDGCTAYDAPILDGAGNFYGTSTGGGKYNTGTIFKLAPDGTDMLLHSLGVGRGGYYPFAGLFMDANGNFYGSNVWGGTKGFGTVFQIASGGREKVLYTFKGPPKDGSASDGTLIRDGSGNFYGTLSYGGRAGCYADEGCGAVFKLAPDGTESVLHFFTGKRGDGSNPAAGLIADSAGNLYGTTQFGGGSCAPEQAYGCGTVFKIAPDGTETILYDFSKKNGANGAIPSAGLVADAAGNLYGTASQGGKFGYGTVFEITP